MVPCQTPNDIQSAGSPDAGPRIRALAPTDDTRTTADIGVEGLVVLTGVKPPGMPHRNRSPGSYAHSA